MIHGCKNGFPLVLAILILASGCLDASDDFDHPNSYIGNADWNGGLVLWVDVARIPLEGGISLPLRLRFTSKTKESLFGGHWYCPLLESHANHPQSHFIDFQSLGGRGCYLIKKSDFISDDGRTKGIVTESGIEISSSGWVYRYKDGKIQEAIMPGGTALVWKYDETGQLTGLQQGDGGSLAELTRTGDKMRVSFPTLKKEFSLQKSKSGWELNFPDGSWEEFLLQASGEVTKMTVKSPGGSEEIFRWKTDTGDLLADSDFTYETRPTDIGRDLLNRVDSKGRTEWYYYDSDKGAAIYKRQDGSRVVSWYDLRSGPTNMKAFRMDTLSEDQKLVSSRLFSYKPDGEIEKEWTEEGARAVSSPADIRFISLAEAEHLHDTAGVLFIDARTAEAFTAGAIPGAVNISRVNFNRDYPGRENLLKGALTLIIYCTSRNCEDSSIVATKLSNLGYKNVLVFEGGWAEWWKHH